MEYRVLGSLEVHDGDRAALLDEPLALTDGTGIGVWNNLALSYLLEGRSMRADSPSAPLVTAARSSPSEPSSAFAFNIWSCGSRGRRAKRSRVASATDSTSSKPPPPRWSSTTSSRSSRSSLARDPGNAVRHRACVRCRRDECRNGDECRECSEEPAHVDLPSARPRRCGRCQKSEQGGVHEINRRQPTKDGTARLSERRRRSSPRARTPRRSGRARRSRDSRRAARRAARSTCRS